jgi:glucose-6-phosphate isomerase
MSAHWTWQDAARFQSCSEDARAQAGQWAAQPEKCYEQLRTLAAQQPLTDIGSDHEMLQQIVQHARALSSLSSRLVVIGTGGASLGAQALCALAEHPSRVRFLENCDPVTLATLMQQKSEATSWLIISKSGETVETLAAALSLLGAHGADADLPARVRVVTGDTNSTLGKFAAAQHWPIIPHPVKLGGRFSVFSAVGLLPAAYAGLNIETIAATAQQTLQHLLQNEDAVLLNHAAWLAATTAEKPMHLLMAYADRLRPATQWYKQLLAESLGKSGGGQTPVTAIGSIDQHSQLQLYLDGPRDKLVTLWLPDTAGSGARLPHVAIDGLAYLGGHAMGEVMRATAEATATTLTNAGVPLRIARGSLSPESLAAWMARQMLETLLVALMRGVDPWSQPAVEEGKRLTRAALAPRS